MKHLSPSEISAFINNGFVRIDNAFLRPIADECRAILWKATQCDPENPQTWTQPVIRIGDLGLEPFKKAANTAELHSAFDQLVGKDNWWPRMSLGSFPIRFPSKIPANDTGWHVDSSFPENDDNDNYSEWRINVYSKGRALLMLFLFSDVTENDAPTVIRVSSHLDVAKLLEPEGDKGLSFMELAKNLDKLPNRQETMATGQAGTVYLCHPFIVHAAQDHHGTQPKFMAQPPLHQKNGFDISRPQNELCAVEAAIVKGVQQ